MEKIVVAYLPTKTDTHRTILTSGGNKIYYQVPQYTKDSDLTTIKLLFNSVLEKKTPILEPLTLEISTLEHYFQKTNI